MTSTIDQNVLRSTATQLVLRRYNISAVAIVGAADAYVGPLYGILVLTLSRRGLGDKKSAWFVLDTL